jgi:hypothetical protein
MNEYRRTVHETGGAFVAAVLDMHFHKRLAQSQNLFQHAILKHGRFGHPAHLDAQHDALQVRQMVTFVCKRRTHACLLKGYKVTPWNVWSILISPGARGVFRSNAHRCLHLHRVSRRSFGGHYFKYCANGNIRIECRACKLFVACRRKGVPMTTSAAFVSPTPDPNKAPQLPRARRPTPEKSGKPMLGLN